MSIWEWPQSTITRVIDGDTIDATVTRDIGFGGHVTYTVRLRLNRVNCPPIKTPDGQRAYLRVCTLLPAGSLMDLQTVKPYKFGGPGESPGEWMVEVKLPGGADLSDLLVTEGLAQYWDGVGPRPGG